MEIKKFAKVFLFLLLINLVVFNWNYISWIFNYRTVSGLFSEMLQKETETYVFTDKENSIEIPKIFIEVPLVLVENNNLDKITKALDFGVVHFPDSVLPGEIGQTIILGHSAPVGWPKIKYDWVFSQLNDLETGDEIYVFLNNREYKYIVTNKIFLEKGQEVPTLTKQENVLLLISCWPPGKDVRRIAIVAQ